ncbi:hypothetical protein B0H10DRAFT_2216698 [Mycena sp. CBHHK59/15]|nr:hypothetical protein B0H10DRAFT_2216698 [Mycena sp. CBHHK59/15]
MSQMPAHFEGTDVWLPERPNLNEPIVGPEISMHGAEPITNNDDVNMVGVRHNDNTVNVWADGDRPWHFHPPSKRVAVSTPAKDEVQDARAWAEASIQKVKVVSQEKRELEAKLAEAQQAIKTRDQEWAAAQQKAQRNWAQKWDQFTEQRNREFREHLEQYQHQNSDQIRQEMEAGLEAEIVVRADEHQKQLACIEEQIRLEQEKIRREQEKKR